jgi:hypothetical protein
MSYGGGRPGNGLFNNKFPPDVPIGCGSSGKESLKIELAVVAGLILFIVVLALICR